MASLNDEIATRIMGELDGMTNKIDAVSAHLDQQLIDVEKIMSDGNISAKDTIELHALVLRGQANTIAKELIINIAESINHAARAQKTWRDQLYNYLLILALGIFTGVLIGLAMSKWFHLNP